MRQYLVIILLLITIFNLAACSNDENITADILPQPEKTEEKKDSMNVQITVGSTTFIATLYDNATVKELKKLLPMTINMSEHNNNEKFYTLSRSLPTNSFNPGTIQNGDLMLYGSNTLVLFYKTFSSSYSYTRIGSVVNPSELSKALGTGSVTVTFELIE